ncbi:hypothetical protein L1049_014719 [Liquidambar formosana]|uniref:NB-ARC domain-containing protein n=1 Tax=Liquidambar formosana TaxID=63359 RepID=A0AAP0X5L9_LIQFO
MGALCGSRLGELSEEDCWSIFEDRAFASGGPEMTSDLVKIGREIVKKCAGVPLAAKVLGGMMHFKKEIHEWASIQKNEIWNIKEDENRILQVLKLSFDNLGTPSLKQCFAYCSMFPKDSWIGKNELIQLWMAQGFLQPSQKSDVEMEDLGNKYFNTLLVNSLLQGATKDAYDNYKYCKMHDLVHDLAQSISSKSDTVNDEFEIQQLSWGHTREIPKRSARKMRTLPQMDNVIGDILLNFKGLRVLSLREAGIEELPLSIGKLKHLRYLDVSWSEIKEFPKSIGKLYHLQTLTVEHCSNLEEFPNELKNLINLRHICCEDYKIMKMPAGMGQLTSLQTLPYFDVGQEKGHQIEELGCLNKLRGRLIIYNLEHVNNGEEAKKANLIGKTNIDQLEFRWGDQRESNDNNENVLEGLQPHRNLKSLVILGFGGYKFPSWISNSLLLNNLVEIKLRDCNKCEQLPALGQLPSLREILISMSNVKCIGMEFYGSRNDGTSDSNSETSRALFPALKTLTLEDMENLREWKEEVVTPATGVGVVFPRLEELTIRACPSLEYIRSINGLTSLRELEIEICERLMRPPNGLESCTSLEKLTVFMCPNLESVPEDLRELCSLRSLKIRDCGKLKCLPRCHSRLHDLEIGGLWEELDSFPNINLEDFEQIEVLRLWVWPKLKSLPHQLQHLTALRTLFIHGFDGLETFPEWLGNLSSLKKLFISKCQNLVNLPPREAMRRLTKLERVYVTYCLRLKEICANKTESECSEIFGLPIYIII